MPYIGDVFKKLELAMEGRVTRSLRQDLVNARQNKNLLVWACPYCGSFHPAGSHECKNCGAPRKGGRE